MNLRRNSLRGGAASLFGLFCATACGNAGSTASGGSLATGGSRASGGSGRASTAGGGLGIGGRDTPVNDADVSGAAASASGGSASDGSVTLGGAASVGGGVASAGGGATAVGGPGSPYLFAVFNDSAPSSDLIIYKSDDALNFTLLYDTKFTGPTGFLRDPTIMKHTDGKFYVAFTTPPTMACCGNESSFSIASSVNLKDWATVATVPAGVAGVKNTWAPEWFKDQDGSVYALVTIDGKTYRYKALNSGLTEFSTPTWIGIGPDYIDTFMVLVGDTYHAFTKHESATLVEHATASSIDGPWTFVGGGRLGGLGHSQGSAGADPTPERQLAFLLRRRRNGSRNVQRQLGSVRPLDSPENATRRWYQH